MMTTRRNVLKGTSTLAIATALPVIPSQTRAAELPHLWMFDDVQIIRLEEDGSIMPFQGFVFGGVRRPGNTARERRVDMGLGPNHWDLLAHETLGPRSEDYYEQRHPIIMAMYFDHDAYDAGLTKTGTRTHDTAHVNDPGVGIHRWAWPEEEWIDTEWKWDLTAVSPEVHFRWRRMYQPMGKDWMWV